jgi:hypothetical protein
MKKGKHDPWRESHLEQRHALMQIKIRKAVALHGCFIMCVFGGGPGFAYSIGVPTTLPGRAEIMLFGLDPETQGHLINTIVEQMREGYTFEAGKRYEDIVKSLPVYFGKVELRYYEDHFGKAIEYHHGFKFDVLQMVWPDTAGKFPWQEGFEEKFRAAQPLLFERPLE